MATSIKLKGDIKKIEAAIKSKATPKSLVPKLEAQLSKIKSELASLSSAKPKKGVTKTKVLSSLQKLKAKIKTTKSLSGYKKSGIDIKKDADVPALPLGKRYSQTTGNPYYEYRLNRADVKQPPKRYPKLGKGGYMAKGGSVFSTYQIWHTPSNSYIVFDKATDVVKQVKDYGTNGMDGKIKNEINIHGTIFRKQKNYNTYNSVMENKILSKDNFSKSEFQEDGGYMADGGEIIDPEELYKKLSNAESKFNEDGGAEYRKVKEQISENRKRYFDRLDKSESKWSEDGGAEYKSLMKMRDKFMKGGYMAKGGALEHGLKVGDVIKLVSGDSIAIYNTKDKNSYRVNISEGKREMVSDMDFNKYAQGGRTTSAINRDRAYKSNQSWEQDYQRKSKPKNPKYKSSSDFFEGGGEMHRLFEEGEA